MDGMKDNIPGEIRVLQALEQDIRENKEIDVLNAYRKTRVKIEKQSRKMVFFNTFQRAASILVIPLLISTLVFIYMFSGRKDESHKAITYTEITAAPGSVVKTRLPDESVVWLNSGSKLQYSTPFVEVKRSVVLTGEAFFDVKTDPDHPFEVRTSSGMLVSAKGTSFNINAYDDDNVHETTLLEGFIAVAHEGQTINLIPNETILLNRETGQTEKKRINPKEKTDWKDGLLIFRNTPLEEVFKRLSRKYNVELNVRNESSVNYRIRATFSTETITQILDVLKFAAPVSWSVKEMEQQSDDTFSRQHFDIVIK